MIVDADTIGRVAIRLGRAYQHSWAKDIPKSVPWTWDMAKYYIGIAKASRLPDVDEARVRITYDHSSSHWTLAQDGLSVDFWDRQAKAYIGYVRAHEDALGAPVIAVRIDSPRMLDSNQLWRIDRAITSLSTERWQPLYSLPPVNLLWELFGETAIPNCSITLHYRVGADGPTIDVSGQPVTEEQRASFRVFDATMARFKTERGMTRWERAIVQDPEVGRG